MCLIVLLHRDNYAWYKPPIDLDLGCSAIKPGQEVATVAYHLPELLKISERENFTTHNCHPTIILHTIVVMRIAGTWRGGRIPHYISTITSESWRVQNLILSTTIVVNGQDPW